MTDNFGAGTYNMALLGASSLKGKEVKRILRERHFPLRRLALLDTEEAGGQLTEFDDEPAIIHPIARESFENVAMAIFASSPTFTKSYWQMAEGSGCEIIDLTYFLEDYPQAKLRAPGVEGLCGEEAYAQPEQAPGPRISVPAHPVSVAIAAILGCASRLSPVQRSVITVYEPVSEHDQAGVQELHHQTVNLLSFQKIPRQVFDSQVAFNLLASYGKESRPTLREVRHRIYSHLGRLMRGTIVQPALRVLQAPVFHGYAFSCFVELKERLPEEKVENALNQHPRVLCRDEDSQPSVVEAAGSDQILLGRVERDPSSESGYWIWGALDNLRFAALNAVQVAEELVAADARQGSQSAGGTVPVSS